MKTRITELFGIKHPIILSGMAYISLPKLVAAVSNAGGLGILASQAYNPDELREAINETRALTDKPFAVNITLTNPAARDHAKVAIEQKVPIINYALGRAVEMINAVHDYGGKIIATVAIEKHALRSEQDGADAIIITGHEAAAHGGNVTSLVLIPRISSQVKLPTIGAGGFCDGKGLATALVLGAEGISMGTRFAVTKESPLHEYFQQKIIKATVEDTIYSDRFDGLPGRALKTKAAEAWVKRRLPIIQGVTDTLRFKRELQLSTPELIRGILRMKKAEQASFTNLARRPVGLAALKRAATYGDEDGIMFSGQNSGRIDDVPSCSELIERIVAEADEVLKKARAKSRS